MKRSNWVAVLIFLIFVFMGGVWTVDVSVSAMLVGNTVMTNGWFFREPMQSYHAGLYMTIASAFAMSLVLIHLLVHDERGKEAKSYQTDSGRKILVGGEA